jgi:hypothetical protein
MNKIVYLLIILLFLFTACTYSDETPQAVMFAMQSGTGFSLEFIFDTSNKLMNNSLEVEELTEPSKSINPWNAFVSGEFHVINENDDSTIYGNYYFSSVVHDNTERIIYVFRCLGDNKAYGSASGHIYSVADNEQNLVGQCEYRNITVEEEELTLTVTHLMDEKWMFVYGDKIFEISEDGSISQSGWIGWRTFTNSDGEELIILMTKGMDEGSKWSGHYNGKLYRG